MDKIYAISLHDIDNHQRLIGKLLKLGYDETYLNDIGFCPWLIVHKTFDPQKTCVEYENINIGFLEKLKTSFDVIIDKDETEFVNHANDLRYGKQETFGLF